MAAVLALTFALLMGSRVAHATHAEGVSITASSYAAGASGVTYTTTFTIGMGNGATIPGLGDVTVKFPVGFDVSSATFVEADSTLNGNPIAGEFSSFQVVGRELGLINFTDMLADGDTFVLTFGNVVNSATVGSHSLDLQVWNHSVGDLAEINTDGSGTVVIVDPLSAFAVTAPDDGPLGPQVTGVPFMVKIAALDGDGDPFAGLTDAAHEVTISIAGSTSGATGLGTLTLDFSATPGSALHTVTLAASQAAETLTVTSEDNPGVTGVSAPFTVTAPPPAEEPEPPVETIVELDGPPLVVVDRHIVAPSADGSMSAATTASDGSSLRVDVPAGALADASGLRLEVAAIQSHAALAEQAPPSFEGVIALASFAARLIDSDGNVVEAAFAAPVTLTVTLPASRVPSDATEADLLLSFWNGTDWVLVPARVTAESDGSVTLVAQVSHFTLFQVSTAPDQWGRFVPAQYPAPIRVTLTIWQGGGYELFDDEVGSSRAWVLDEGRWYGYSPLAPAFVNQVFLQAFPDGVQRNTVVVLVQ